MKETVKSLIRSLVPTSLRRIVGDARRAYRERFPRTILVVRGAGIGDLLMTTPALRGLRRAYPRAHIGTAARYPEVFIGNPNVDEVVPAGIAYSRYRWDKILRLRYDERYPMQKHITEIFCDCAGVPLDEARLDMYLSPEEEAWAQREVTRHGGRVITIQPWPGEWTRNKDWYADRWEQVVSHLTRGIAEPYRVLQIGASGEQLIAGTIDYRGTITLRQAIALIKYSVLLVGCNSFAQQAARALGTPAVILYGSTAPHNTGYEGQICLSKPVPCGPCGRLDPCPYAHECMTLITAEDVVEAVGKMLGWPTAAVRPYGPVPLLTIEPLRVPGP